MHVCQFLQIISPAWTHIQHVHASAIIHSSKPCVARNESSDILYSDAEVHKQGSGPPGKRARTSHQQENELPPHSTLPASSHVRPPLANVCPNSPSRTACEQDCGKSQASPSHQGHKQSLPLRCVKSQNRTLTVCIHVYIWTFRCITNTIRGQHQSCSTIVSSHYRVCVWKACIHLLTNANHILSVGVWESARQRKVRMYPSKQQCKCHLLPRSS